MQRNRKELSDLTEADVYIAADSRGWTLASRTMSPDGTQMLTWRAVDGSTFASEAHSGWPSPLREALYARSIAALSGICPLCGYEVWAFSDFDKARNRLGQAIARMRGEVAVLDPRMNHAEDCDASYHAIVARVPVN